jgi:hypothetical protein
MRRGYPNGVTFRMTDDGGSEAVRAYRPTVHSSITGALLGPLCELLVILRNPKHYRALV